MPFHSATENMAALLRSARLLKFSPSGLLQTAAIRRNGPPLGRLYSGALSAGRTGVCSRQISPASGNSASRVWPSAAGCVRNYAVATEQQDEPSVAVRTNQAQQFDWALARLDSSVRRTGRITKTLLLRIFHNISRTGYPSGNQALLLLRSCGSLLPEVPLEERTELAHRVWEKMQELGAKYDVSHYNALLKVYLQNEFKFSPTDFLAKMEVANIQPNRVTYQRLIAAYCQNGDIEGASTILGFMKSKSLPITEAVFNSLVTGHARADDIESAKNILPVMRGAGIEPGPDTYVALMNAYAEKGDMDSLKKTMEEADSADCGLMDRDIMQVIFTLAKAGYPQHIPNMVERLRHERGYLPDAMNLCLNLVTQNQGDTAFQVLKTFPTLQSDISNIDSANVGNFLLRHCVNMEMPLEKLVSYCKDLQKSNLHTTALSFTLYCALDTKKTGMSLALMKVLKEQDSPIRPHYFWPLLAQHIKDGNTAGLVEVVKGMQELKVQPDGETLSTYILPAFPSTEAARQALQDAGVFLKAEGFLNSEIRTMASGNLAKLCSMLLDPSCPAMDFTYFRGSLSTGFRKSDDVESMVKITELLYKDQRFWKENTDPAEATAYFLYSVIDNMTQTEVQAQEDKLRKFFNQLQAQNITISGNLFRGIRNLLDSYHIPELIKDVIALVDPNDRVSAGSGSSGSRATGIEGKVLLLEKRMADLKARDKPFSTTLKLIIKTLCADEDLQRALELKKEHEAEMTIGAYAAILSLCCRHDNVEEALNLKREISEKDPSVALDASKYIGLVKTLAKNDRVEEAVDILKEMKEKEVVVSDMNVTLLFYMLSTIVNKGGGPPVIRRLQDTIFTLGLTKPTSNLCSPLITAYLNSNDLTGALDAAIECQKRYGHLPRIHDIIVGLVEKGDTEQLQRAMDFMSHERGEMTMLYDLFFAFLQSGRYREARKIIETPGLRARPGRLNWFAEKCIAANQMETLEQMVDMTAKLFECDRDEMYSYILRLCNNKDDWQTADAVWTKMQEENVIPRERTMRLLADVLRNNGQEVPFEVPETWYEEAAPKNEVKEEKPLPIVTPAVEPIHARLLALSKQGNAKEAYEMLMEADEKGVVFGPALYDQLIRALLAGGSIEDAMAVKEIAASHVPGFQLSNIAVSMLIITHCKKGESEVALEKLKSMLQENKVPSHLAVVRLVQALGSRGDLAGIQEVETLIDSLGTALNTSNMLFINNSVLAHIANGDLESAVEMLEAIYTSPDSTSPSMGYIFKKVLEGGNDKAIDKLSAMAERLANHFACYRPAADLFLQLLDVDKVEDAKFMLARCNAVAEQKEVLMSYLTRRAQKPGQSGRIKTLLSLIPDFAEKDVVNAYLMKCHVVDQDLPSAKALYEQMQKEGAVLDELSLKRLAGLYRVAGEEAPFTEPPESFKFYADQLKEKTAKAQTTAEA